MGLLKNLYFDFSFVTKPVGRIISKRKSPKDDEFSDMTDYPESHGPVNPSVREPEPIPQKEEWVQLKPEEGSSQDKLPSLAMGLRKESFDEAKTEIPKELPKLKPTKSYEKKLPDIKSYSKPPAITTMSKAPHSFFSQLLVHLNKEHEMMHERVGSELIHKNLFDEMKVFWEKEKGVFDRDVMRSKLEEDLKKKLVELRDVETEWQRLQIKFESTKKELNESEHLLDNKIKELKMLFFRMFFEQCVPPDKTFKVCDGRELKNLSDLLVALRSMDKHVFDHHVSKPRNDFAIWVDKVMGLSDLADLIQECTNKIDMADLIQNYSPIK